MKERISLWALRGLAILGLSLSGTMIVLLGFTTKAASPQGTPPSIFTAPSHVPVGESWVLLGSAFEDLPGDLVLEPLSSDVKVLQVQKLSVRALGVLLQVGGGAAGNLLHVTSAKAASEWTPDLYLGQTPPPLAEETNIAAEDYVQGALSVGGDTFFYACLPAMETPLGAVRIHNRATGVWHAHEMALEKARGANAPPAPLDPAFVVVDPLTSPVDTDGNGIPDYAEAPEPRVPAPEQLGVKLTEGRNTLDVVALDERGVASWKVIEVYSSQAPPGGGF